METFKAHSNKTELKDRVLFYDGDSVVSEKEIAELLASGLSVDGLFVEEVSNEVKKYNSFVTPDQQIKVKKDVRELQFDWNLPDEYSNLDPIRYVVEKFNEKRGDFSPEEFQRRKNRIITELSLYEKLQLVPILRVLIFIINTLTDKKQVWGVGRGSSVSSYVLYIIGVHDVDSYKYDLSITDFLRSTTDILNGE